MAGCGAEEEGILRGKEEARGEFGKDGGDAGGGWEREVEVRKAREGRDVCVDHRCAIVWDCMFVMCRGKTRGTSERKGRQAAVVTHIPPHRHRLGHPLNSRA